MHVVKVRKIYDITKPWLEKVGALCKKKEDVPILTHPLVSEVFLINTDGTIPVSCLKIFWKWVREKPQWSAIASLVQSGWAKSKGKENIFEKNVQNVHCPFCPLGSKILVD